MKIFKVNYRGLWLGGTAIVIAKTEEEAIELARNHRSSIEFEDVTVEELPSTGVVYNDNGDY
ncbi:hypothetical protein [Salmonella phage S124]|uniref:Uncharacterized protein n=1 Tax=Salmonella phage S124 TaxID=2231351 RepID=A0A2Z5HTV0_9CAUD|nr:hypothetical protein HOT67_gp131 [Salmonella phage S124]AXC43152.1 hypothetical protein [Salmonella phage S124]